MHTHAGDEAGLVLQGRLRLELGGDVAVGPGDSVSFSSSTSHRYRNTGDETCVAVWAGTEPR